MTVKQRTEKLRAQIDENTKRIAELNVQLDRSLQIQALVPDAFRAGKASSHIVGNEYRPREMTWTLTRGDGSTVTLPLTDVPETLWGSLPEGVKQRVKTQLRRG